MMKQATMEMWYGFRQRMKTFQGWVILALIIFVLGLYYNDSMEDSPVAFMMVPYILGFALGWMSGSNTGKLNMVLPMSSKEYKRLIYMKTCWLLFWDMIGIVIYITMNQKAIENYFELIFIVIIPSLMSSGLLFIRSSLPIKPALYEKGYKFPMWTTIVGTGILCLFTLWGVYGNIWIKMVFCLLIYAFLIYAIWKVERRMFNQRIYYDEVEEEAGKVHW